jgi:hypothetical protein
MIMQTLIWLGKVLGEYQNVSQRDSMPLRVKAAQSIVWRRMFKIVTQKEV